jgi:hypothetical protein
MRQQKQTHLFPHRRRNAQTPLPGGFENEIVLSDEFLREVTTHPIPTDLEAAKLSLRHRRHFLSVFHR